jgi:hypothetical protein
MLAALAVAAAAHPMGDTAAAQTSVLVIRPDRVDVDYVVDVPNVFVETARPGAPADPAAMTTELASGLVLTIDGRTVAMRLRDPSPPPRPSSEHTTGFVVRLSAPLPPDAETIELQTANLQGASNRFAADVRVHPDLAVETSSLLGLRDGRIVRDDTLRWTRGEENRRLTVTLAPRAPRWWTPIARRGDEPVRVARAWVGARDPLRPPTIGPGPWLAALGLAGAAGLTTGRDRAALALALLGIALAALPGGATGRVELASALGTGALALAGLRIARLRPLVGAAAVAGLAATTHTVPAAVGVVLLYELGIGLGRTRPRAALIVALGIGGLVLARGLAAG